MIMKNNFVYKELIAVVKFKDYFKEANDFLKDDKVLSDKGFSVSVINENANHGIAMTHKKQTSGLMLNGILAQYDAKDIPIEVAKNNILTVFEKLQEARWRFSKTDDIEYVNIGIKVEYDIDDNEVKLLRLPNNINSWLSQINFKDKFNHTIDYYLDKNKLLISMDINSKGIKEATLKDILQKVNSYVYNPTDFLKCLGASVPSDIPRDLGYIIS